jgi:hypothetical protein
MPINRDDVHLVGERPMVFIYGTLDELQFGYAPYTLALGLWEAIREIERMREVEQSSDRVIRTQERVERELRDSIEHYCSALAEVSKVVRVAFGSGEEGR